MTQGRGEATPFAYVACAKFQFIEPLDKLEFEWWLDKIFFCVLTEKT